MVEQRKHTRIDIAMLAELTSPKGDVYIGQTRNISFGGLYILLTNLPPINPGDQCEVSLIPHKTVTIKFRCTSVHQQKGGIGLKFVSIDALDYTHFKNIMVANSSEPEKLLKELEQHPGLSIG